MIRRQLTLAIGTLVAFAFLTTAVAQDDSVLQRYDLAIENLQVATASVPQDGAQARDELERALNALLTLSRDATSTGLVQAMERTFERTRVAVDNQSRTDMAVQTAVLSGGFSRLIMDSAYQAAANGDVDTARRRLLHVAARMGFDEAATATLAESNSASALRLAFETGAADALSSGLTRAAELAEADPDGAYVQLATVYGDSLLIQDSPRADPSLNRDLVAAANALVSGDTTGLEASATAARTTLVALATSAREGAASRAAGAAAASDEAPTVSPAPEELPAAPTGSVAPSATQAEAADATTSPQQEGPATPVTDAAEAAASEEGTVGSPAAGGVAPDAAATAESVEQAVAARLLAIADEAERERVEALTLELVAAGLPRQAATTAAGRLAQRGYNDLADVIGALEAPAARVVGDVARGDQGAAKSALTDLLGVYRSDVAATVDLLDPGVARSTADLLGRLSDENRLTQADAGLVAARVAVVRDLFQGGGATLGDEVEGSVMRYWSGQTRNAVFLILGILAIFPLILLNMAFGGSNRNWRLVGWALFLLLVPVFYQAVLGLVGLLGAAVDLAWLPDLARWSPFGGEVGQVAWALLVLLALILATLGLRGICVQFGLLGGGTRKAAQPKATAVQPKGSTGHTTIDWDEEF